MSRSTFLTFMTITILAAPPFASATVEDPFSFFNVFSRCSIGRSTDLYDGEIRGIAGAAGSCWFKNNSINALGLVPSSIGCFAGGEVELICVSHQGSIEAAGRVLLRAVNLDGGIASGVSIWGHGATIGGDAAAMGTVFLENCTVSGAVIEGAPFTPSIDLSAVGDFYLAKSAQYGSWGGGAPLIAGSRVEFSAAAGINVFDVTAADLDWATSVAIEGPHAAWVIINVRGHAAEISTTDWQLDPRMPIEHVLINFPEAAVLEIRQVALLGNVLAPQAATHFPEGLVVGGLWVGDLQGGGQVDWGFFIEPIVPTSHDFITWGGLKSLFE
ncbi:MAG: choice-of-anchor A family protein [Candidatus Eisenbacteria sp.]|nr:choice-of-anchor A family protein [Candidatus Eisenbacteria bacterium]